VGSFKAGVGNVEECTQCPEGYITYQTGSVSNSSCIEETPPDSNSGVQSEASVPSVSFNFSVSGLSASDDPEKLRQQLIAARHFFCQPFLVQLKSRWNPWNIRSKEFSNDQPMDVFQCFSFSISFEHFLTDGCCKPALRRCFKPACQRPLGSILLPFRSSLVPKAWGCAIHSLGSAVMNSTDGLPLMDIDGLVSLVFLE
jgi:hypothetical protein